MSVPIHLRRQRHRLCLSPRLSKLVFIESGLLGILPAPERSPWHVVFQFVRDLPERLVRGNERAYLSWFFGNLTYAPTAVTSDDIDKYVRIYAAPGAMRAGFEYYRNWSENRQIYKEYPRGELSIPVLALGGMSASGDVPIETIGGRRGHTKDDRRASRPLFRGRTAVIPQRAASRVLRGVSQQFSADSMSTNTSLCYYTEYRTNYCQTLGIPRNNARRTRCVRPNRGV